MKQKIEGNFSEALYGLIRNLIDMKNGVGGKSIVQIFDEWDKVRGNDWFIQTLGWEEQEEIKQLQELKNKYEM